MTLDFFERFRENLERSPDRVGLQNISEEGRQSFTYRQIKEEVSKISLFLQRSGVQPGHGVGILMENHPRWGIAFLAAQSAGATVVPFDILHGVETLTHLIQHAECRFLISSERFLPRLREIQQRLPTPLPVLISGPSPEGHPDWDTILDEIEGSVPLPLVSRDLDEPFVIIYTSGTTGSPKGVVLTRRNVYRNVVELLTLIQLSAEDHILSVLPLYHVLALMANFVIPLYVGARVTYLDALEAQRILKTFQEEGITIFVCVPQFYYLVHGKIFQEIQRQFFLKRLLFHSLLGLSHFCQDRLGWNPGPIFFSPLHKKFGSQLRLFGVGGARFDRKIAESFHDLGFRLVQAYGMTETAALATVTPLGSHGVGSVGQVLPHVKVYIDQPNEEGIGEVLIRGENVMKGYWKNPEETAAVICDGWLYSGDLGKISPQGFLHITGRKKDVIVLSSGNNIFPEELEHYYQSHCPFIKEMCVVGVHDTASREEQERLHAVVVPDFDYLKSQQIVNAYDMIRYHLENLSQRVPSYKRVHSFELRTDPFPRTTTRKIKRFQVQEELIEKPKAGPSLTQEDPPETDTEKKIFELIRQFKKAPVINRKMNLELDLGFDSLERVELLSNVEQAFQSRVSDDQAVKILTLEDLVSAVEEQLSGKTEKTQEGQSSWDSFLEEPLNEEVEHKVRATLRRRPMFEVVFYLALKLTYLILRLFFRLKVTGKKNIPREYPLLICPNHLSFLDAFAVASTLPYHIVKRLFFLGYSDYFTGPIMAFWARLIKLIPTDPDRHLRQALRLAAEGLRRDLVLCIFPEGERSIDGNLKPFRKGAAILASQIQVPLVPVGIVGTYEVWRRGSNKIRLHPVQVHFGKLLRPSPHPESHNPLNQHLFDSVKQLIGEEQVA